MPNTETCSDCHFFLPAARFGRRTGVGACTAGPLRRLTHANVRTGCDHFARATEEELEQRRTNPDFSICSRCQFYQRRQAGSIVRVSCEHQPNGFELRTSISGCEHFEAHQVDEQPERLQALALHQKGENWDDIIKKRPPAKLEDVGSVEITSEDLFDQNEREGW